MPCTNCAANFSLTLCLRSQLPFLGVKEQGPQGPSRSHFSTQDAIRAQSWTPFPLTQDSDPDNHLQLRARSWTTLHYAEGLERRSHKETHVPEWGTHKADGPKGSRGGILFEAFRAKVRNLQMLKGVNVPFHSPSQQLLALTGTGVS